MRKTKTLLWASLLSSSLAVAQSSHDTTAITWKKGYLDIHHINTGRGNSAFVALPDGTTLLIDAGDLYDKAGEKKIAPLTITPPYPNASKNSGQWIADYIKQVLPHQTKPVLDYALITHYHSDHMGIINAGTKTSANGPYKLSGITQVGDIIPIKKLIDRGYDFPTDLKSYYTKNDDIFPNLLKFINTQQKNGLVAESLKVGHTDQLTLIHDAKKYPTLKIRGIKSNGTIWTGKENNNFEYFSASDVLDKKGKFNENPLSNAIKISYGKFDYYTGGDNTGLQGFGLPHWFDVETPIAKAVGKVEVATLDHHGNRDATNENFLHHLQPQVMVEQTWCSDHPGQEVMHRITSDHIYPGKKNIFATNIQEVTKATLGFWFTKGYKSLFGHVILRVLPGGDSFYVLVAETIKGKVVVKKAFGPYPSY